MDKKVKKPKIIEKGTFGKDGWSISIGNVDKDEWNKNTANNNTDYWYTRRTIIYKA